MSVPYSFTGTDFPSLESRVANASTGDGTEYPLTWNKTQGGAGANEIVPFEWHSKEYTLICNGSVTLTYSDGVHIDVITTSFALSQVVVPQAGANASIWEPGGAVLTDLNVNTKAPITLGDSITIATAPSWGPSSVTIQASATIQNLYGLDDSATGDVLGYTQYVKNIFLIFGALTSSPVADRVDAGTWQFVLPGNVPLGTADVFHGTPKTYVSTGTAASSLTITTWSLKVTDKFPAPPDL